MVARKAWKARLRERKSIRADLVRAVRRMVQAWDRRWARRRALVFILAAWERREIAPRFFRVSAAGELGPAVRVVLRKRE